ncbi:MAG: hypothetical protein IKR83_02845 [Bacteroidales bacterium]|nr:hypothetical protein [Bacteroidales bacterium]
MKYKHTILHSIYGLLTVVGCMLMTGCWGNRYVSADPDLEALYMGRSYYDIVREFGQPDATITDGREGTKVAYNNVSLSGSSAATLYRQYNMRNRSTHVSGTPMGGITFSFNSDMKCYAVDSDFEHERIQEPKAEKPVKPGDPRRPDPVKPKIPRTIDYPYYESCSPYAKVVSIEKVEIDREKVKIYFQYRDRTPDHRPAVDSGIYIMPEVYLEDCRTLNRYNLIKAEGITLYPEYTKFAHNRGGFDILNYCLTFEPVSLYTEYINIVEPGHSGFNFYGVDVRTPITTKEELKNQESKLQ